MDSSHPVSQKVTVVGPVSQFATFAMECPMTKMVEKPYNRPQIPGTNKKGERFYG